VSAAFDSQAVAAKPLASLSSPERSHLKATLDKQHELIKGCFAEALAAAGSYASLVALNDAIVVNCETEQQYELDGEHAPDHARLRGDLAAAMAKAGPGGRAGAAWVGAFRAKYDAHDEAFDEPAFGSLQAPSSSLPLPPPAPPRSTSLTSSTSSPRRVPGPHRSRSLYRSLRPSRSRPRSHSPRSGRCTSKGRSAPRQPSPHPAAPTASRR